MYNGLVIELHFITYVLTMILHSAFLSHYRQMLGNSKSVWPFLHFCRKKIYAAFIRHASNVIKLIINFLLATRAGGKQSVNSNRSAVEADAIQANNGIFQCSCKHGNVTPFNGSGQQVNHDRRFTNRICALIHFELYIYMWDDQRQIHAEQARTIGVCLFAVINTKQDHQCSGLYAQENDQLCAKPYLLGAVYWSSSILHWVQQNKRSSCAFPFIETTWIRGNWAFITDNKHKRKIRGMMY